MEKVLTPPESGRADRQGDEARLEEKGGRARFDPASGINPGRVLANRYIVRKHLQAHYFFPARQAMDDHVQEAAEHQAQRHPDNHPKPVGQLGNRHAASLHRLGQEGLEQHRGTLCYAARSRVPGPRSPPAVS